MNQEGRSQSLSPCPHSHCYIVHTVNVILSTSSMLPCTHRHCYLVLTVTATLSTVNVTLSTQSLLTYPQCQCCYLVHTVNVTLSKQSWLPCPHSHCYLVHTATVTFNVTFNVISFTSPIGTKAVNCYGSTTNYFISKFLLKTVHLRF